MGIEVDEAALQTLIHKLRRFVAEDLVEAERAAFALLLAPGVSLAYGKPDGEVEGFAMANWGASQFHDLLGPALRAAGIRVTGLD